MLVLSAFVTMIVLCYSVVVTCQYYIGTYEDEVFSYLCTTYVLSCYFWLLSRLEVGNFLLFLGGISILRGSKVQKLMIR